MSSNVKLTYLHYAYDDTIATIHKYYRGAFLVLHEHLSELISEDQKGATFTFSDRPFSGVEARQYVEIE